MSQLSRVARDLEQLKIELSRLSEAFYNTGNDRVSVRLHAAALTLTISAATIRYVDSQEVTP